MGSGTLWEKCDVALASSQLTKLRKQLIQGGKQARSLLFVPNIRTDRRIFQGSVYTVGWPRLSSRRNVFNNSAA